MRNACLTMSNLGFTQMLVGELADAEASLRRAHALAERMGLRTVVPFAMHNLGAVLYYRGEHLDEARRAEELAVAAFVRQGDPRLEAASRIYLSAILLAMGDAPGAEEAVRAALGNENAGEQMRVGLHAQLARVLGAKGEIEASLAAAREAMRLLEPLGVIEDFDALARLSIAEALDGAGHREAARDALASAVRRLEERADRLKNPRLREGFLRKISVHARTLELAEAWGSVRSG
jgi:tetratricopeptide (TPR) repeat protein